MIQAQYFFDNCNLKLDSIFHGFFLFLDFDGTLVPIQDNPSQCVLSPNTKSQLETMCLSGKASIAILSGRAMNDLKKRIQIENIYYGGNHGLEITGPNLRYVHPDALIGKRAIDTMCRKIEKRICNIEGALIEKKNRVAFVLKFVLGEIVFRFQYGILIAARLFCIARQESARIGSQGSMGQRKGSLVPPAEPKEQLSSPVCWG